jgi:hypothetical protein
MKVYSISVLDDHSDDEPIFEVLKRAYLSRQNAIKAIGEHAKSAWDDLALDDPDMGEYPGLTVYPKGEMSLPIGDDHVLCYEIVEQDLEEGA